MNIHHSPFYIFVFLMLIGSAKLVNANPLSYQLLHLIIHYYHTPVNPEYSTILMGEICNNGIDDDGDGAIDTADSDCQCNGNELPNNLIPNGNFSAHTSCCAALATPGFNCLDNWVALEGSADYISDACPDTDLRPDVRALSNHFDTPDEDAYVHLILSSGNGRYFNESMGICLDEPLMPGNTYTFSFDIANLRKEVNTPDVRYTFFGIPNCANLTDYKGIINNQTTGTCVSGSPFERIATIQTGQTRNEWVLHTFEFSPVGQIEAFFFAIDCDNPISLDGLNISLIMDNFSMVQQIEMSEPIQTTIAEVIPAGGSYEFGGEIITTPGYYFDSLHTTMGCDSIVILNLIVTNGNIEDCNNGIDDDGDGLIDAFDEDCNCNSTENLVSNGDFEQFQEGCCSGSVVDENICISNWPHTHSTPDFIHPTCIGSVTPAEANYYDVPLDGAFMGILLSYANSPLFPQLNGSHSETIGQCLAEPLIAGETYTISFDMGIKGNLDGTPIIIDDPFFFTVNGISDCNRLGEYLPDRDFCDSGLPFQQLASANLMGLNPGWNSQTFTFTPTTDLEAIFVMGDCDLDIEALNVAIALIDNLVIQKAPLPIIPNEIIVEGNPCDENNMLRFSVEQVIGATYQWYLDSIPQDSRRQASLTYGLNANIVGMHHVYVTFPDGQCQLIGPYEFDYPERISNDTLTLCQGETVIFNNRNITIAGDYSAIFPSIINGCDSIANLVVFYEENPMSTITDTIVEGQSYDLNGTPLTTTGIYRDTLPTMHGCDSLITLDLVVIPPRGEICDNNIDDDGDGLTDVFDPDCQCRIVGSGNPATTINIDGPHCDNDTRIFIAGITSGDYQWYKDSVLLIGETSPNLSLPQEMEAIAGLYHLSLIHTDGTCQLLAFSTDAERPANVDLLTLANICEGTSYQFGDSLYTESGIYVQTFTNPVNGCDSTLTLDLNVLSTIIGDTLIINQDIGTSYTFHGVDHTTTGIFQANLTATTGCDSLVWLNFTLTDPCANLAEIMVEWADTDCEIAANGWINLLTQNGNPPFEYAIDGGINYGSNNFFENLPIGDYDIVVRDNNGCVSTNSVSIQSNESNLFIELPADTILMEGQSISLAIAASNIESERYQWVSEAIINCPDCPNIRLSPTVSGNHILRVTDVNGCQAIDSIFIELKPIPKLYLPNVFSPNADRINDIFRIEGTTEVLAQVAELSIYNRWGDLVFQQQKTENFASLEWDGSVNNQVAAVNVYMYVVTWINERGETERLTGDFTLIK